MSKKRLLLVDDNTEMLEFLRICLENEYDVEEAINGKDGLHLAFENIPDLIVTDVAMPEMDGYAFCRYVKSDERTNHIPVIMLTAKVEVDQQVEGLDCGADIYLTKPFSTKVLQSYIRNLLSTRETLRQYYSQKLLTEPLGSQITGVDKKFIERLMTIIHENISNPGFHVNDLSRSIGMSTAVLYKKFNALSDVPIAEFIKSLRLKKAAALLKDSHGLNVSEIAWEVGFSDRKYFSKEFKKYSGYTPSEFISSNGA